MPADGLTVFIVDDDASVRDSLALRAIAQLVVVLQIAQELVRRQAGRRPPVPSAAILRVAAGIHVRLLETLGQVGE